jgi:hypothetical protein
MDIIKKLKDLRVKFDNQPGNKLVPEFIKASFIKLGFQTNDIQSVKPFKNLTINGNDFAVFDSVDNTNTLYKAIQNISDAIGHNSYLTKQAVRSLGNLQHTDNIEGITANYFKQSGITHTGFWDLQRKYDQKGDDYKAIIKADKAFSDRVFDGVGPFKIALNDFFKMNNQLTVDKFDQAIDKELTIANSKTRKKMKP